MRLPTLLLLSAALLSAAQPRYARLGEFQGQVEIQLTAADPWIPAERNLPLPESAWLRTGASARLEIELDDASAWRLGPDSLGEISDYTQLSTGQRITLLSLDHGTAYFTGEPRGKDVLMLVVPGAQVSLSQGSRMRVTAHAGFSQVAVLEGQARFSSPAAEMDIREGTTARVEPATPSRFFLYPEVAAEQLDRWSEDRDKIQAAPVSATHVTARYGTADLDSAGDWLPTDDLGLVWKPKVAQDWAPYQKGRWRYFEALGYTWVSDDTWGWLPYHNGRWARKENLGWVWQPAVGTVFHPGEAYWLRGPNFAGWGPLGPNGNTVAANTTYAAFQPDVRTIDPAGFPAPTAEQLRTAAFVAALPSPAFLVSRLDAVRPVLQVGATRVKPSVPGVTFGDTPPAEPPSDLMTNPVNDAAEAPPVASDGPPGATPPPDGVYPIPVAIIPVIEWPVVINPPDHPDYSRRPGSGRNGNSSPLPPVAAAPNPPASSAGGSQPGRGHPPIPAPVPSVTPPSTPSRPNPRPQPVTTVPGRIETPKGTSEPSKVDPSKVPDKKAALLAPGEGELYQKVLKDVEPGAPNFVEALADLELWSHRFPASEFENDRRYYYIHAYNGMGRAEKVLEMAGPLVSNGVGNSYHDPQQVLQILVAAAASVQKLPKPNAKQLSIAQRAARELLSFLPDYFASKHKPAGVSDATWSLARTQLESVAKKALDRRA